MPVYRDLFMYIKTHIGDGTWGKVYFLLEKKYIKKGRTFLFWVCVCVRDAYLCVDVQVNMCAYQYIEQ